MTRKVLVTGVSSGIGRAQALAFLEEGDIVYGIDRNDCSLTDKHFHFIQHDLTSDLPHLLSDLPQIDVLCNTAGVLDGFADFLELSESNFRQVFETNFFATVALVRLILPKMIEQGSGTIINMCSIASFVGDGGGAAYTASKHALAGFTKQLALDYAKDNISVFGIAPGSVKTGMTQSDFSEGGASEWVTQQIPIGRYSEVREIAQLTLFLASGKVPSMQGEIVKIDGGWTLK